jgi:hypothetical protein
VRMIYEVYALNLGRDVTYWFPSRYAGRNYRNRSEVQNEERQAVASNTFHPKLQEALQRYVLPQTVHFSFDNPAVSDRDDLFRLREFVELGVLLYRGSKNAEVGVHQREPLASRAEIRRFLAEADRRFEAWTPEAEPVTESHDDMDAIRALPEVQRAVAAYRRGTCGDDAVVDVRWRRPPNGSDEQRRKVVGTLAELARPQMWTGTDEGSPAVTTEIALDLPPVWLVDGEAEVAVD